MTVKDIEMSSYPVNDNFMLKYNAEISVVISELFITFIMFISF